MTSIPSLFFVLLFAVVYVQSESVHWQWRELSCKSKDSKDPKDASSCVIQMTESETDDQPRKAPLNPCIEETFNGKPRTYCNVLCPGADTVYLIKRSPGNHRSCFGQITYKIEKKDGEFYLWRDGKCRSSDVDFKIRCEFAFGRKEFPEDQEVFQAARKVLA